MFQIKLTFIHIEEESSVPVPKRASSLPPMKLWAQESEDVPEKLESQVPGTWGHPELCRRPCIFAAYGTCTSGASCAYCHEQHQQQPKMSKRMREKLSKLGNHQKLCLLIELLHEKMRALPGGFDMLSGLTEIAVEALGDVAPVASDFRFKATLSSMPVSGLLGDTVIGGFEPGVRARLKEELSRLRQQAVPPL